MSEESITITIPVKGTPNPRIFMVGDMPVHGRIQVRRELKKQAEAQVEAAIDSMFPKPEEE